MSNIDLILSSLEIAADIGVDITEPTYKHYFEVSPESLPLMAHMDHLMRGRMLTEVINLMIMPDDSDQHDVVRFEVKTHKANGVDPEMYDKIFNAVYRAVRNSLDEQWTQEFDVAWKDQITGLNKAIKLQAVE